MELKGGHSQHDNSNIQPLQRNPFNGIESSIPLASRSQACHRTLANPFNGIESVTELVNAQLTWIYRRSPFNGIERIDNMPRQNYEFTIGIHLMELKVHKEV